MRSALVLVPLAGPQSGPDLTRYLVVCTLSIGALIALGWCLRRFGARHMKARAARRSLQVLDVLPLGAKQKLVVVRCYDRSFLLGLGEREVRSIAELELEVLPVPSAEPRSGGRKPAAPFPEALAHELLRAGPVPAPRPERGAGLREDVLA
jgi:flagellar biosynthetic protein FliO